MQHRHTNAANGPLIGRQQGNDPQRGVGHLIKVQPKRLRPNKVRPEAGFLGVAFKHCMPDSGGIEGQTGPAKYGFSVDGSHGVRVSRTP